jgi:hypothetical protein
VRHLAPLVRAGVAVCVACKLELVNALSVSPAGIVVALVLLVARVG